MFPSVIKQLAQIDDTGTIQLQSHDSCASGRRQPDDECEIPIPREMFRPVLATWMKERNRLFGQRIIRFRFDVFMAVATLTGQSQIVSRRFPALIYGDDVFDGKG